MVDWIKLEKDDLNGLSYRTAKPEEKAILLDLIGLAMIEDIELPYNSIDNLIEYEELANLLNVKETTLANTIRRFGNFIKIERTGDVIKIKITFIEIAKGKISEKSDKAKNASKARWGKEKEEKTECTSNANAMQTHNASNANAMQMECREDKNRVEKNRKEENKKEENILNTVGGKEKTILSSKLDGEINKPISTFSTSKEIQSTSKEIQYLPPKQEKTPYTAEFEEFWAVYNKKEGSKAEAFKKFKQALKEVELPRLIEKVKAYNRSKRVQDGYKCDPVTWLNQRRWESDYTPTTFLNAQELNECWDSLPLERQKNIEAVRWLMS